MKMNFPFDPIERSKEVERVVMKDGKRLYSFYSRRLLRFARNNNQKVLPNY